MVLVIAEVSNVHHGRIRLWKLTMRFMSSDVDVLLIRVKGFELVFFTLLDCFFFRSVLMNTQKWASNGWNI